MKQFYHQVVADEATLRFYALCANCGKRINAGRLPLLCRDKSLLTQYAAGTVGGIRQTLYNRSYGRAVQRHARFFNRCPSCGKWVCDDCFDLSDGYGACKSCAQKSADE